MKMRTSPRTPQFFGNFLNKKESFILRTKTRKSSKSLKLYFLSDCYSTKRVIMQEKTPKDMFDLLPLILKNKNRLIKSLCCLAVCVSRLINFWMSNQALWNLVYISWHLSQSRRRTSLNPAISLCVCTFINPIVARQQLGKHVPAAVDTGNNRRIVRGVVFYAVRVVSK
jgi:hypothetical protein